MGGKGGLVTVLVVVDLFLFKEFKMKKGEEEATSAMAWVHSSNRRRVGKLL